MQLKFKPCPIAERRRKQLLEQADAGRLGRANDVGLDTDSIRVNRGVVWMTAKSRSRKGRTYDVRLDLDRGVHSCSCEDHTYDSERLDRACIHQIRVAMHLEGAFAGRVELTEREAEDAAELAKVPGLESFFEPTVEDVEDHKPATRVVEIAEVTSVRAEIAQLRDLIAAARTKYCKAIREGRTRDATRWSLDCESLVGELVDLDPDAAGQETDMLIDCVELAREVARAKGVA